MRFALLASAAMFLTANAAMAQSTTASPAPTGAPNAAMTSPGASPGNMAPAATVHPTYSGQNSINTAASGNPAPTGAPGAAQVTPPGASPGNMAPNNGTMASTTKMHGAWHSMAMPADGDAKTYLHIAADAIKRHDKMRADDALSHAETRMLDRAVPASTGPMADDSPAVTSIEHARQALAAGDFATAASDTKMAMHEHHGMMGSPDAMGGPAQ